MCSPAARLRIGIAALLFGLCLGVADAQAQNETWVGPGTEWTLNTNWSNDTLPTGIATFTDNMAPTGVFFFFSASIGEIDFTASAPAYTFAIQSPFEINGVGIV